MPPEVLCVDLGGIGVMIVVLASKVAIRLVNHKLGVSG